MSDYRRFYVPGGTYFFTVVTFERRPFLTDDAARRCLRVAWQETRRRRAFRTVAVCLLPDHLHCIWTLPQGDADFSGRWNILKGLFSKRYLGAFDFNGEHHRSCHSAKQEAALWQRRFWEHWIRDEDDLRRHLDYVHFNPVKHGYAMRPTDWQWSSIHRYLRLGWYDKDWGSQEPEAIRTLECAGE